MKTINRGLLLAMVLIVMSTLSCKKDTGSPSQIPAGSNSYTHELNGVIWSDWFHINDYDWIPKPNANSAQQYIYNKDISAGSANHPVGKILVFGKGGTDTRVNMLPFTFDQTDIEVEKQSGNLKFTIAFLGEHRGTSLEVSFKYILIPTGESSTISNLNYNNYYEVCSYYGIPE